MWHFSKADYSLFVRSYKGNFTTILVHIDDIILASNKKHLGNLKYFMGIEVAHSKKDIFLSQKKYALEVLDDIGFLGTKLSTFPIEQNLTLHKHDGDFTRLDLAYVVQGLSQFMDKPCTFHLDAGHRILCYIKQSLGLGIILSATINIQLHIFCDAD